MHKTVIGNFDFEKSLKRLEAYSLSGHLEAGVRVERLLLRHENNKPLGSRKDFVYSPGSLLSHDSVSEMLLENHKISFDGKRKRVKKNESSSPLEKPQLRIFKPHFVVNSELDS